METANIIFISTIFGLCIFFMLMPFINKGSSKIEKQLQKHEQKFNTVELALSCNNQVSTSNTNLITALENKLAAQERLIVALDSNLEAYDGLIKEQQKTIDLQQELLNLKGYK